MPLTHGSLFTGVGGTDLGFDAAGIETKWQCEIDPRCRSVLAKHWPDAKRYTDVSTVKGDEVEPVDIITFGSPCQDLSSAGRRAGFEDGTRSSLFFEAIRIIKEMRDGTDGAFPRFAIWENVRGALGSRDGDDFGSALQALADLGAVDISWRVVNTCHFGPPQRRLRVFVVADFGGECAGGVLAEPARVLWHPPARTGEGAGAAGRSGKGSVSSFDGYNMRVETGPHRTLRTGIDSGDCVLIPDGDSLRPRRLTPRECERLQGWPDDHTRWTDDGRELATWTRYKMCGNGISAPVAQWIGENIITATQEEQ